MHLTTPTYESFDAYSYGATDAKQAILLIHDWWGIQPYNKVWAERLAMEGFRALLIDLYDGHQPKDATAAGEFMRNLDQNIADRKLRTALDELRRHHQRIAVMGWSFGGLQAQYATFLAPETVNATVFFYSRVIIEEERLAQLTGRVLGIFSETERTWPEKQQNWETAMSAAGKSYEAHSYDADHGFVNDDGPRYDADATEASWQLSLDFLRRTL